jgi:hypothetical protein
MNKFLNFEGLERQTTGEWLLLLQPHTLDSMYKDSSTCMAAEDLENALNYMQ